MYRPPQQAPSEPVHAHYEPEPPAGHRLRDDLPPAADYFPWYENGVSLEAPLTVATAATGVRQGELCADWTSLLDRAGSTQVWTLRPRIVAMFEQLSLLRALAPSMGYPPIARAVRPGTELPPPQQNQQEHAPPAKQARTHAHTHAHAQHSALGTSAGAQLRAVNTTDDAERYCTNLARVDYPLTGLLDVPSRYRKAALVNMLCDMAVPLDRALWMIKVSVKLQAAGRFDGMGNPQTDFGSVLIGTARDKLRKATSGATAQFLYLSRLIAHCYYERLVGAQAIRQSLDGLVPHRKSGGGGLGGGASFNGAATVEQVYVWATLFQDFVMDVVHACAAQQLPTLGGQLADIAACVRRLGTPAAHDVARSFSSAADECFVLASPITQSQQMMLAQAQQQQQQQQQQTVMQLATPKQTRMAFCAVVALLDTLHSAEHNDYERAALELLPCTSAKNSCRQMVRALCEWAVTDRRAHLQHRPCSVLALLRCLVRLTVDNMFFAQQQQPQPLGHSSSGSSRSLSALPAAAAATKKQRKQARKDARLTYQPQLVDFLRTHRPESAREAAAVADLFATLIHGGVFSHNGCTQQFIANGLLQPWAAAPDDRCQYHRRLLEALPVAFCFARANGSEACAAYRAEKNQRTAVLASIGVAAGAAAEVTKRDIACCIAAAQKETNAADAALPKAAVDTLERLRECTQRSWSSGTFLGYKLCAWACARCLPERCICTSISVRHSKHDSSAVLACCCRPTPAALRFVAALCDVAGAPVLLAELVLRALKHRACAEEPALLTEVLDIAQRHTAVFVRLGRVGKLARAIAALHTPATASKESTPEARVAQAELRAAYYRLVQSYGTVTEVTRACKKADSVHAAWSSAPGSVFAAFTTSDNSADIAPALNSAVSTIVAKQAPLKGHALKEALAAVTNDVAQLPLLAEAVLRSVNDKERAQSSFKQLFATLSAHKALPLPRVLVREALLAAGQKLVPLSEAAVRFLAALATETSAGQAPLLPVQQLVSRVLVPSLAHLAKSVPAAKAVADVDAHVGAFLELAQAGAGLPWSLHSDVFNAFAPFLRRDAPGAPAPPRSAAVDRFLDQPQFLCALCSHPYALYSSLHNARVQSDDIWAILRRAQQQLFGVELPHETAAAPSSTTSTGGTASSNITASDALVTSVLCRAEQCKWGVALAALGLSFLCRPEHLPCLLVHRFALLLRAMGAGDTREPRLAEDDAQLALEVLCHIMRAQRDAAREGLVAALMAVFATYKTPELVSQQRLPSFGSLVVTATRQFLCDADPAYRDVPLPAELEQPLLDEHDSIDETLLFGDALANLLTDSLPPGAVPDTLNSALVRLLERVRNNLRLLPNLLLPLSPQQQQSQPPTPSECPPQPGTVRGHILALLQVFRHAYLCLSHPLARDHALETAHVLVAVLTARVVQAEHDQVLFDVVLLLRLIIQTCRTEVTGALMHSIDEMHAPPLYATAVRRALEQERVVARLPKHHRAVWDTTTAAMAHAPKLISVVCPPPWRLIPELYDAAVVFPCRVHRGELTYGPHAVPIPAPQQPAPQATAAATVRPAGAMMVSGMMHVPPHMQHVPRPH